MKEFYSRWYDKDPVLSMSMRTLANSDDATQIQVALNLIKVIIEHNIKSNEFKNVEDIMMAVEEGVIQRGVNRWYDLEKTVRTAIQMLERCSPETRQRVALDMAQIVIENIVMDKDGEDELDDDQVNVIDLSGETTVLDLDKLNEDNEWSAAIWAIKKKYWSRPDKFSITAWICNAFIRHGFYWSFNKTLELSCKYFQWRCKPLF